jgi:hypothetical protein
MEAAPIHRAGHGKAASDVNYTPGSRRSKISKGKNSRFFLVWRRGVAKNAIQEREMHQLVAAARLSVSWFLLEDGKADSFELLGRQSA